VSERSQLARGEQAVRNRNAQHGRIALNVQAVTQPERSELIFGKLAFEETPRLVPKLRDALIHQPLIDFVVYVHGRPLQSAR
jgi:hypothetical protein